MEALKTGKSRIVVCVDMFGEGIDIPNLKIAAIHDRYKSLPITLQFIGHFARSKAGLGDATIIPYNILQFTNYLVIKAVKLYLMMIMQEKSQIL